jgi:thioredoxin
MFTQTDKPRIIRFLTLGWGMTLLSPASQPAQRGTFVKTPWLRSSLVLAALVSLVGAAGCDAVVKQLVTVEPVIDDGPPPRPEPFTATRGKAPKDAPREFAPLEPREKPARPPSANTVLLDFTAEWCGPCKMMKPLVDNLANRGYPVRQIDIDSNRGMASKYGIRSIPCFVLLVDGQEVERVVGAVSLSRLEGMFLRHQIASNE